jgi:polysaccharide biosynthesis transport protein
VTGTVLIRVTVTDGKSRAAADIANAVATVLPQHDPSGGLFTFTQTDPAHPPTTYSSPNVKVILLAGAALAILLAVGAALLYDVLAGTVDTTDQLSAVAGTEVLAVLPQPKDVSELSVGNGATSAAAGFRSLRRAIEFAGQDKPIGVIVVAAVSADQRLGEWLACNLAASLAQVHHTVLLVDGDLAAPATHPMLSADDSPGLNAVLRDETGLDQAFRPGPIEGLTILPSSDAAAESTDSLVETRLPKVLAEVDGRFDSVIVLTPSPGAFDITRVMGVSSALLLGVPAGRLRVAVLRRLAAQIESARIRVLGAVLIRRRHRFRG